MHPTIGHLTFSEALYCLHVVESFEVATAPAADILIQYYSVTYETANWLSESESCQDTGDMQDVTQQELTVIKL